MYEPDMSSSLQNTAGSSTQLGLESQHSRNPLLKPPISNPDVAGVGFRHVLWFYLCWSEESSGLGTCLPRDNHPAECCG